MPPPRLKQGYCDSWFLLPEFNRFGRKVYYPPPVAPVAPPVVAPLVAKGLVLLVNEGIPPTPIGTGTWKVSPLEAGLAGAVMPGLSLLSKSRGVMKTISS